MRIAALTYVYNEIVNFDLWRKHYGFNFGEENLYVIDRGSNDGSTENIGRVNKFVVPRIPFDDLKKIATINLLHHALLQSFDCVVVTDCDELLSPDPEKYENLRSYIEVTRPATVSGIGLNIHHVITQEPPLDLEKKNSGATTVCGLSSAHL